jgi:hypothetical protein
MLYLCSALSDPALTHDLQLLQSVSQQLHLNNSSSSRPQRDSCTRFKTL